MITTQESSGQTWMGPWHWAPSTKRVSNGINEGEWVFRIQPADTISEEVRFTLVPAEDGYTTYTLEHRGYYPVKITGFYLAPIPETAYSAERNSSADIVEIIRWGDEYGTGNESIDPGIKIGFFDDNLGDWVWKKMTSGNGDQQSTPLPFLGELVQLNPGQTINIAIKVVAPDDATRQIESARRFQFGLEIEYIQLTDNILLTDVVQPSCPEEPIVGPPLEE